MASAQGGLGHGASASVGQERLLSACPALQNFEGALQVDRRGRYSVPLTPNRAPLRGRVAMVGLRAHWGAFDLVRDQPRLLGRHAFRRRTAALGQGRCGPLGREVRDCGMF